MKTALLLLTLLLTSCSLFQKNEYEIDEKKFVIKDEDYIDQLSSLKDSYLNTQGVTSLKLSKRSLNYLEDNYYKLVANNKLLLKKAFKPSFNIIKSDFPFYFSLPKGQFFFSSALILKYFKNEEIFVAVLASEIVKSHRNIYIKSLKVPVGYIDSEDLIKYTRLPVEVKSQINNWTYHVLKRSNHDPYAYLVWIQSLNKNTLDFSIQYGNTQDISREEFLFKSFIASLKLSDAEYLKRKQNSTKSFYTFIREVKRRSL